MKEVELTKSIETPHTQALWFPEISFVQSMASEPVHCEFVEARKASEALTEWMRKKEMIWIRSSRIATVTWFAG